MGLGSSLSTALTGLRVSQQSISVLAQNISNANNENYTRQVVSQSTIVGNSIAGNGVRIDEVTRVADQFVNAAVLSRTSLSASASVVSDYYNQSQIIIGQPGQENSIDSYTQNFFESLHTLSNDTENSSLKLLAVDASRTLTNEVSGLAQGIEELRFQADQDIALSVSRVNTAINTIFDLNVAVGNSSSLGQSINTIADQIDAQLAAIAQEINISYEFNDAGQVSLSTANGLLLTSSSTRYNLSYDSANSVQEFIDDSPRSAITLQRVDNETGELNESNSILLVSAGDRDEVTSKLSSGRISGLVELRDQLFPNILDQLDNFVSVVRDEVNAIYNSGASFPPETSLTGSTLIDPTVIHGWRGTVRIAALQSASSITDGQPVASPYASQANGIKPLDLNLGTLTDESLAGGTISFQTIIDEINNYYGIPQNRASIGDIANIELVSKSDSLAAGTGSFDFNLETTNLSANNQNFTVTGITTSDPNIVVTTPAAFPTSTLTSSSGATELASVTNFSLDFSNGAIASGPYSIDIEVSVDDGNGGFFTDTISYTIAETPDGLINDRFGAASVSGTGDATLESPTNTQPILTALLVDENGVEVARNPATGEYVEPGFLKIEGRDGVGVAIDELDSTHLGNFNTEPTNFGFSHYFGLNNFFVTGNGTNPGQVADAAISFKVREDIDAEPGKIALAQLQLSSQSTNENDPPRFTYEVSSGNNDNILRLDRLSSTPISFDSAGGISRSTVTFNSYASQILGFVATVTSNANESARKENLILQGFADKKDSIGGVNIDEEIANTIIFQNAYAANARVISVIGELFDDLLNAV